MKKLIKIYSFLILFPLTVSSSFAMDETKQVDNFKQYAEFYVYEGKNIINPGQEVMSSSQLADAKQARLDEILENRCGVRHIRELKLRYGNSFKKSNTVSKEFYTKKNQEIKTCDKIQALSFNKTGDRMAIIQTYNKYECTYILAASPDFAAKSKTEQQKSFEACVGGPKELPIETAVADTVKEFRLNESVIKKLGASLKHRDPASVVSESEEEINPSIEFTDQFENRNGTSSVLYK